MSKIINQNRSVMDRVPRWLRRVVVSVIAVAAVGAGIYFLVGAFSGGNKTSTDQTDQAQVKTTATINDSQAAATRGDYDEAQKILSDQAGKENGEAQRGKLYEQQAVNAFNAAKYEEALRYAKQAESTEPSKIAAVMMYESAMKLGDKKLAAESLQKVLDRTTEIEKNGDIEGYQEREATLRQLKQEIGQ